MSNDDGRVVDQIAGTINFDFDFRTPPPRVVVPTDRPLARFGQPYRLTFPLVASGSDHFVSPNDLGQQIISDISRNHGPWASTVSRVTDIGSGICFLDLTAAEMQAGVVLIVVRTQYAHGIKSLFFELYPHTEEPLVYTGLTDEEMNVAIDPGPRDLVAEVNALRALGVVSLPGTRPGVQSATPAAEDPLRHLDPPQ